MIRCVGCFRATPAALLCLLSVVGLFRVATGDGQPTPCIVGTFMCWALGVPGQDVESRDPAEVGVRVEEEEEEDAGEEDKAVSPASFRGCSWRMDS